MNAIHLTVDHQDLPVADLADIIRSKEAAGRPKDFSALPALQRRLAQQAGIPLAQRIADMTEGAEARSGASPAPQRPPVRQRRRGPGERTPRNDPVAPHHREPPPTPGSGLDGSGIGR